MLVGCIYKQRTNGIGQWFQGEPEAKCATLSQDSRNVYTFKRDRVSQCDRVAQHQRQGPGQDQSILPGPTYNVRMARTAFLSPQARIGAGLGQAMLRVRNWQLLIRSMNPRDGASAPVVGQERPRVSTPATQQLSRTFHGQEPRVCQDLRYFPALSSESPLIACSTGPAPDAPLPLDPSQQNHARVPSTHSETVSPGTQSMIHRYDYW